MIQRLEERDGERKYKDNDKTSRGPVTHNQQ